MKRTTSFWAVLTYFVFTVLFLNNLINLINRGPNWGFSLYAVIVCCLCVVAILYIRYHSYKLVKNKPLPIKPKVNIDKIVFYHMETEQIVEILSTPNNLEQTLNICLGKDWYMKYRILQPGPFAAKYSSLLTELSTTKTNQQ